MSAQNDKLEIVPDGLSKSVRRRSCFACHPLRTTTGRSSRQAAIVAADTEDEARQVASKHDAFGTRLPGSAFRRLRHPGHIGDPRFWRRGLSLRAVASVLVKRR